MYNVLIWERYIWQNDDCRSSASTSILSYAYHFFFCGENIYNLIKAFLRIHSWRWVGISCRWDVHKLCMCVTTTIDFLKAGNTSLLVNLLVDATRKPRAMLPLWAGTACLQAEVLNGLCVCWVLGHLKGGKALGRGHSTAIPTLRACAFSPRVWPRLGEWFMLCCYQKTFVLITSLTINFLNSRQSILSLLSRNCLLFVTGCYFYTCLFATCSNNSKTHSLWKMKGKGLSSRGKTTTGVLVHVCVPLEWPITVFPVMTHWFPSSPYGPEACAWPWTTSGSVAVDHR